MMKTSKFVFRIQTVYSKNFFKNRNFNMESLSVVIHLCLLLCLWATFAAAGFADMLPGAGGGAPAAPGAAGVPAAGAKPKLGAKEVGIGAFQAFNEAENKGKGMLGQAKQAGGGAIQDGASKVGGEKGAQVVENFAKKDAEIDQNNQMVENKLKEAGIVGVAGGAKVAGVGSQQQAAAPPAAAPAVVPVPLEG